MPAKTQKDPRALKLVLHGLFLLTGSGTVLIGQLLPILAKQYSLSDLEVSYFFPAQFAGSVSGTLIAGRFAHGSRKITASVMGAVSLAAGFVLLNADAYTAAIAAFFLVGIGVGLTLPSANMAILELSPRNAASALSVLNFCWGIGAILCKPFVDLSSRGTDISMTTLGLAVPTMLAAAILILIRGPQIQSASDRSDEPAEDSAAVWSRPLAWAIAVFNLLNVGFETGMGGWLTTYAERSSPGEVGLISPTLVYFAFFVIGRGVAPLKFRFLSENSMLMLGLVTILIGMTVTVSAGSLIMLTVGAGLSGYGTSWIFPTNVARFSKELGRAARSRATPLFVAGTLGAAASTWSIGYVSDLFGSLRSGMYVLFGCVGMLIVIQLALSLRRAAKADSSSAASADIQ